MRKLLAAIGVVALIGVVVAAIAIAAGEGPSRRTPSRSRSSPATRRARRAPISELKVDPVANGTFGGLVTISNYNGKTFDWALTSAGVAAWDVAYVIVKGGPNANLYMYDFAADVSYDDSDTGLHAPLNPNGNTMGGTKVYGFSHIAVLLRPEGRRRSGPAEHHVLHRLIVERPRKGALDCSCRTSTRERAARTDAAAQTDDRGGARRSRARARRGGGVRVLAA